MSQNLPNEDYLKCLTFPVQLALSESNGNAFFSLDIYETFNMVTRTCEVNISQANRIRIGSF